MSTIYFIAVIYNIANAIESRNINYCNNKIKMPISFLATPCSFKLKAISKSDFEMKIMIEHEKYL